MAVSINFWVFVVGVPIRRDLLFGFYNRGPDFGKSHVNSCEDTLAAAPQPEIYIESCRTRGTCEEQVAQDRVKV